jgi:hypothetical protein
VLRLWALAIKDVRTLAGERLVAGAHAQILENAVLRIGDAVAVGPEPKMKPRGAPSKRAVLEEACELVEFLRPLDAPYPRAAELLTSLGFPYTAASLKTECRRMRREKPGGATPGR